MPQMNADTPPPMDAPTTPDLNSPGNMPPPDFDADEYKSKADIVYNGDKNLSGTINLGTKDNPKIIYVGGKLYLKGTIHGYGIFIVKEDVEIHGDVIVDPVDPLGSKLGIYTNKKFMINYKDVEVHAQVFAMEDVILNEENLDFYGTITSKKDVVFNGQQVDLFFKPASPYLIDPFWDLPGCGCSRLAVVYYNEQ